MAIKYSDFKKKGLSLKPFLKFHNVSSVVIFGTDSLAEECFQEMSLCGIHVKAFIALEPQGPTFLGRPLLALARLKLFPTDMAIIASNTLWYAKENAYILQLRIIELLRRLYNVPAYSFIQMMQQTLVFEQNLALFNTQELAEIKKYIFIHHSLGSLPHISPEDEELLYIGTPEQIRKTPPLYKKIYHDIPHFSEDYIRDLTTVSGWIKEGGNILIRMADRSSPYHNVIEGRRLTTDVPERFHHTCHLLGPCMAYGYGCEDSMTIASFLQRKLNAVSSEWRVLNHSVFDHVHLELYMPTLLQRIDFQQGDIILYFNHSNYHTYQKINEEYTHKKSKEHNFHYTSMYKKLSEECTKQKLYFSQRHIAPDGCRLYADVMFATIKDQLNVLHRTTPTPEDRHFPRAAQKYQPVPVMTPELQSWLHSTKKLRFSGSEAAGAIVMNCNPFTLGHRYIIEKALLSVKKLYIFVVEEDKSYFPFKTRLRLVQQGVQDLANVRVIPSGKFIISAQTFGEYFTKDSPEKENKSIDASSDLHIFAKYIAPVFNITTRFVGEEPFCQVTRQYNASMKEILPQYNINVTVFKRLTVGDTAVSASQVRKIFQKLQETDPAEQDYTTFLTQLKALVPHTTLVHLLDMQRESSPFMNHVGKELRRTEEYYRRRRGRRHQACYGWAYVPGFSCSISGSVMLSVFGQILPPKGKTGIAKELIKTLQKNDSGLHAQQL